MAVFHNPRVKHPLDPAMLPAGAAHHRLLDSILTPRCGAGVPRETWLRYRVCSLHGPTGRPVRDNLRYKVNSSADMTDPALVRTVTSPCFVYGISDPVRRHLMTPRLGGFVQPATQTPGAFAIAVFRAASSRADRPSSTRGVAAWALAGTIGGGRGSAPR